MKKMYTLALAFISWFALLLQLFIMDGPFINFISYFTIQSNLLVALSLTTIALFPHSAIGQFFSSVRTQSAIALYILIVGIIYNLVLRGLWQPQGWQLLADNLLHVVVPLLYIFYWLVWIPKKSLKWKDGINWLYFPILYLCYALVRGHFTQWFPYPFLNTVKLGYQKVSINALFVTFAFLCCGLVLIGFNKIGRTKR